MGRGSDSLQGKFRNSLESSSRETTMASERVPLQRLGS